MTLLPSLSATSPLGLFGLGGPSPIATLSTKTTRLTASVDASSVVELSGLGQFLSAVATFQNGLAVFRPGEANSGLGSNFGTDFGSLAAEAQYLVDTVNGLQGALDRLTTSGSILAPTLAIDQLSADLAERLATEFDNGDSALTTLADLGITLNPAPLPGLAGRLSIDFATLRSAFETDPEGSFALLGLAADALEGLAGGVVGPADGGFSNFLSLELTLETTEQTLTLFDQNANGSGLFALTDLLTLASLGQQGSARTQAQRLAALSEMSLVASMLG